MGKYQFSELKIKTRVKSDFTASKVRLQWKLARIMGQELWNLPVLEPWVSSQRNERGAGNVGTARGTAAQLVSISDVKLIKCQLW